MSSWRSLSSVAARPGLRVEQAAHLGRGGSRSRSAAAAASPPPRPRPARDRTRDDHRGRRALLLLRLLAVRQRLDASEGSSSVTMNRPLCTPTPCAPILACPLGRSAPFSLSKTVKCPLPTDFSRSAPGARSAPVRTGCVGDSGASRPGANSGRRQRGVGPNSVGGAPSSARRPPRLIHVEVPLGDALDVPPGSSSPPPRPWTWRRPGSPPPPPWRAPPAARARALSSARRRPGWDQQVLDEEVGFFASFRTCARAASPRSGGWGPSVDTPRRSPAGRA